VEGGRTSSSAAVPSERNASSLASGAPPSREPRRQREPPQRAGSVRGRSAVRGPASLKSDGRSLYNRDRRFTMDRSAFGPREGESPGTQRERLWRAEAEVGARGAGSLALREQRSAARVGGELGGKARVPLRTRGPRGDNVVLGRGLQRIHLAQHRREAARGRGGVRWLAGWLAGWLLGGWMG
jgi:hypothetical protein